MICLLPASPRVLPILPTVSRQLGRKGKRQEAMFEWFDEVESKTKILSCCFHKSSYDSMIRVTSLSQDICRVAFKL